METMTDLHYKLMDYIRKNKIQAGAKIPGERSLSQAMNESRPNIRKVLQGLVNEGILYVKPNSGYYLSEKRIVINIGEAFSHFNPLNKKGYQTLYISKSEVESSPIFQQEWKDKKLFKIIGIQVFESESYGVIYSYLPFNIGKDFSNRDLSSNSLYQLLEETNNRVAHTIEDIDGTLSNSFEETIFNLSENSYLVKHSISCFNEQGKCVLIQNILYPAVRIEFKNWRTTS